MINEVQRYQGVVFAEIARAEKNSLIHKYISSSNSSYVVNGVGVFIKYSTKRMSPWQFTFQKDHQEEIFKMKNDLGNVVVVLVCGYDGIACLDYKELKNVLNEDHKETERISVSRPPRGKYKISGTDGKLKNSIGMNEFPGKIFDLTSQKSSLLGGIFNRN